MPSRSEDENKATVLPIRTKPPVFLVLGKGILQWESSLDLALAGKAKLHGQTNL
jgi:hypothetical protein